MGKSMPGVGSSRIKEHELQDILSKDAKIGTQTNREACCNHKELGSRCSQT